MMDDVSSENFELVEEEVRDIEEGEILVKNLYLSFDPTQRGWLNDVPSYIPPVQIGEVMRAGSVGKVIESKNQNFSDVDNCLLFGILLNRVFYGINLCFGVFIKEI